jgi:nucleoside-diphosphate-sugar epimerase
MAGRRVLVTGGAGFLGTHLAASLLDAGVGVRVLDVSKPGPTAPPELEYVRGDVRDPGILASALEGVTAIVHAAFASPQQPPDVIGAVNVDGTRRLCAAALAGGVRRLVLVSSTIVLKAPKVHPFLTTSPLSRLDLYRASRAAAETLVEEHGRRGGPVAVVRPKTLVGPGGLGAFALAFDSVRAGRRVWILGPGTNRYQLLDVRDLAAGICLLATSEHTGVFAFGASEFGTVREDFQALADHAGTGARLCFVRSGSARLALRGIELSGLAPLAEWHYMSAAGQDSIVDTSRAREELGWRPRRSNARALADAYDWYAESRLRGSAARPAKPIPRGHRLLASLGRIWPGAGRAG